MKFLKYKVTDTLQTDTQTVWWVFVINIKVVSIPLFVQTIYKETNMNVKPNIPRTCSEVMEAACPSRTAKGAQVCKHHTLIVLSQEPAAIMVFS